MRALFLRYLQRADLMLREVVAGGAFGAQALQAGQRDVDHVLEELALAQRRLAACIARHRARRGTHRGHTTRTREARRTHSGSGQEREREGGVAAEGEKDAPICKLQSHRLWFR